MEFRRRGVEPQTAASPSSVHHVRAQGQRSPSGFDLVSIIYQSSGEAERHMQPPVTLYISIQ